AAVGDSKTAEVLNLVFERTSRGTRTSPSAPDTVSLTVLPLFTTSTLPANESGTERATVALTLPCNVTRPGCACAITGITNSTAINVKRRRDPSLTSFGRSGQKLLSLSAAFITQLAVARLQSPPFPRSQCTNFYA